MGFTLLRLNKALISAKVVKVVAANDLALLKAKGRFAALPVAASGAVKLGGLGSRRQNVRAGKVFVLCDGLGDLPAGHGFQADSIGQTEPSFARLPTARRARVMQAFIHSNHFTARQQVVEEGFHRFPPEASLHERPRFMRDIIGGEQGPAFLFRALKGVHGAGMKRIGSVETGIKAGRVHEHGLHAFGSHQALSWSLTSSCSA